MATPDNSEKAAVLSSTPTDTVGLLVPRRQPDQTLIGAHRIEL
jgi:hypothetical protein